MDVLTLYPDSIDPRAIARAAEALRAGRLVVFPTDTHPAVGADSLNPAAVAALCRLKGIDPERQTLTLACNSIASAAQYARIDNRAFALLKRNTPGPVTFLLPVGPELPKLFKKRKQLGIRIPANPIALALAEELGHPIASGSLGLDDPMELEASIDLLLADASAEYADDPQSSTIVDVMDSADPVIVRPGAVDVEL